jgi:hypothetical protein
METDGTDQPGKSLDNFIKEQEKLTPADYVEDVVIIFISPDKEAA